MSFKRWGYEFDGSFPDPDDLESLPGVYVIKCRTDGGFYVLDVGQAEDVKDRCRNHERFDCWDDNCGSGIFYYSAHYMPDSSESDRIKVERDIRDQANPPCGER